MALNTVTVPINDLWSHNCSVQLTLISKQFKASLSSGQTALDPLRGQNVGMWATEIC